jgi:hypothetical protein
VQQGTIKIHSSFFILYWMLFIFKPTISIDGGPAQKPGWGDSVYPVEPGQHTVQIKIPYIFYTIGKATETVSVAAGETVALTYRPQYILFLRGKLKLAPSVAAG